jgi:hypothetical protein
VIGALAAIGDVKLIPRLMPYLEDTQRYVQDAAITAIDTLQAIERTAIPQRLPSIPFLDEAR